jgi:hypothetical protein
VCIKIVIAVNFLRYLDDSLGEVMGVMVENEQRTHCSGEGSSTAHGGHGRFCGHGWEGKTTVVRKSWLPTMARFGQENQNSKISCRK